MNNEDNTLQVDDEILIKNHLAHKNQSIKFKERRFQQWNENYYLYRDKVLTNRLTQRQPINLPIMRETIQTWISKIDEPPLLTFESRTKDNKSKDGEIVLNELWAYYFDVLKLDILDNLDKKVVGLQGRSFKMIGWSQNSIFIDIIDPYDIEISPSANPLDLNSARKVTRTHIFIPLREILANKKYSERAKLELKLFLSSEGGIIKAKEMENERQMKLERLQTIGALNVDNYDHFKADDVTVEINEGYELYWDSKSNKFVRYLIKYAADKVVLYKKPMKDAVGVDSINIVSWADDPDLNDQWPDGKGDSVRTINKVCNMYFSQDLENRTYRNFGMYFFNTMNGKFQPKAFDPKPFGMYGVPGNPAEMVQQMKIEPLGDTANQIMFLKNMIQSSVAQTPTERGIGDKDANTLGEVKINLRESTGRNITTAKNYRRAWKELGTLFYQILNANSSGQITLYKKGTDGEYRAKTIMPSDWQNPSGYECKVVMKSEKEVDDRQSLQQLQYVKTSFKDNPIAMRIARRKELELLGWRPEEIEEVMQYEDKAEVAPTEDGAPVAPGADAIKSPIQMEDLKTQ